MNITRRKFFFFGLAAGVGLMLPDMKIQLSEKELIDFTKLSHLNQTGLLFQGSLMGVPYHYTNATTSTWLGIKRN